MLKRGLARHDHRDELYQSDHGYIKTPKRFFSQFAHFENSVMFQTH